MKTNDTKRTEDLAHNLCSKQHDTESVSNEMYFIPDGYTVKKMADLVREKDKILLDRADETEAAQSRIEEAKRQLEEIKKETEELLTLPNDSERG